SDEAHVFAAGEQPGDGADEERALLFAEGEPSDVARNGAIGGGDVVDASEAGGGKRLGDDVDVGREDEADAGREIAPARPELPHRCLAVFGAARLEDLDRGAELAGGARNALVGRVVEALVAAAADVEDEADPDVRVGAAARRLAAARRQECGRG